MSRVWLENQLGNLRTPDETSRLEARARAKDILRPLDATKSLDEIAIWVAGWQNDARPSIHRPAALIFAANHGVAAAGVSKYPVEVTASMVEAFRAGSSTINAWANIAGASVEVVDVGVENASGDIRFTTAVPDERFDEVTDRARRAVEATDTDLLVIGEMGIGNTTAAAAVCLALLHGEAENWAGRGTGVDDHGLARKVEAIRRAVDRLRGSRPDASPIDVLAEVGGLELVAMAAAIVAARQRSLPVIIDGYVVTAAALALATATPNALDHCWVGHRSAEPGHGKVLKHLSARPLLDLDLRLGEASGAMAAVPLIRMACAGLSEVPTFSEWFGSR
jgi:nicotinate-nucleotide--dimethylbenzimidazole phosphoribosyltransferase